MSQELEIIERREVAPLTAHEIKAQVQRIQEVMQAVMQEGYHYGIIPGTDKPTLLKPGAEKLGLTFRMAPRFRVTKTDLGNGHREYEIVCTLEQIGSGAFLGEGVGSCSTMESKYRYRKAERECPMCGNQTIIRGKAEYGGGWLCFQKKGGCGEKFLDKDPRIAGQHVGRIENPDIADQYNSVLKIGKKRAQIDATLTATAASDIFTQDLDEMAENEEAAKTLKTEPKPEPQPPQQAEKKQTAQSSTNGHPISDAQVKFLATMQSKHKVSDDRLHAYLREKHSIESRKEIKGKDLNDVLAWLSDPKAKLPSEEEAERMDQEEREARQSEAHHA